MIGRAAVIALVAFMTLPTVVVIVVSVNPTAILSFPPTGFSLRWYVNALTYPQFQRAAVNSLLVTAAASLGATPWRTFRRVTLPLLAPGLTAGLLFAVIVSANEFVVSLFVSNRVTEILPVAMFSYVVNYTDPTIAAMSTLFIGLTFAAVWLADRFFGLAAVFLLDLDR